MSLVYFFSEDGNSLIALDCEESISISKTNDVSSASVMSGDTVSDGFKENNKVVSIGGLITYSKSSSQVSQGLPNPIEFQNLVDAVIRTHTRFKLYTDESDEKFPLLKGINLCVVASYSISVEGMNSIRVDMQIQEVFVSDAAKTTFLAPIKSEEGKRETSDNKEGTTGKSVEKTNETILKNLLG